MVDKPLISQVMDKWKSAQQAAASGGEPCQAAGSAGARCRAGAGPAPGPDAGQGAGGALRRPGRAGPRRPRNPSRPAARAAGPGHRTGRLRGHRPGRDSPPERTEQAAGRPHRRTGGEAAAPVRCSLRPGFSPTARRCPAPGCSAWWRPGLTASARPGQILLLRPPAGPHPALRSALPLHRIGQGEVSLLFAATDDGLAALSRCRAGRRGHRSGPAGPRLPGGAHQPPPPASGRGPGRGRPGAPGGLGGGSRPGGDPAGRRCRRTRAPARRPAPRRGGVPPGHRRRQSGPPRWPAGPAGAARREQPAALGRPGLRSRAAGLYLGLRRAIAAVRTQPADGFAQAMVEGRLAAAWDACLGCAVATRRGIIYLCKHGPVLDLNDLLL